MYFSFSTSLYIIYLYVIDYQKYFPPPDSPNCFAYHDNLHDQYPGLILSFFVSQLCLDAKFFAASLSFILDVRPPFSSPNSIRFTFPVLGFVTYTTYFFPGPEFLFGEFSSGSFSSI